MEFELKGFENVGHFAPAYPGIVPRVATLPHVCDNLHLFTDRSYIVETAWK